MQEYKIQDRQFMFNAGIWESRQAVMLNAWIKDSRQKAHVECRNIRLQIDNSYRMQQEYEFETGSLY
jgi:hypothetical protein